MNLILQKALQIGPKVGKRVYHEGELFDQVQNYLGDKRIIATEICKGADRYRAPPSGVSATTAKFRRAMGLHRNMVGHFIDQEWETWITLSRKNLIRTGLPSKLMRAVFSRDIGMPLWKLKTSHQETQREYRPGYLEPRGGENSILKKT